MPTPLPEIVPVFVNAVIVLLLKMPCPEVLEIVPLLVNVVIVAAPSLKMPSPEVLEIVPLLVNVVIVPKF